MRPIVTEYMGRKVKVFAERMGQHLWIHMEGQTHCISLEKKSRRGSQQQGGDGILEAPMPGKIIKVHVKEGDQVSKGQTLVVLEAMKMEYNLASDVDGVVDNVQCTDGDQVTQGQQMVVVKSDG